MSEQATYDKVIQVRISPNVWDAIEGSANRLGIKTPEVIRLALGEYAAKVQRSEAISQNTATLELA